MQHFTCVCGHLLSVNSKEMSATEHACTWETVSDAVSHVYTSACINRRSACSDMLTVTVGDTVYGDLLAFGTSYAVSIARLIKPHSRDKGFTTHTGFRIMGLLLGHTAPVNCVRWIRSAGLVEDSRPYLLLASADNKSQVKIWSCTLNSLLNKPWSTRGGNWFPLVDVLIPSSEIPNAVDGFVLWRSTSDGCCVVSLDVVADTRIHVWHFILRESQTTESGPVILCHRVTRPPSYATILCRPSMCLCLRSFCWLASATQVIHFVIVGLDTGVTEIWAEYMTPTQSEHVTDDGDCARFIRSARLTGHTDWVRCLDLCRDSSTTTLSLFLATGGQDNVIRLWHIFDATQVPDKATMKVCDLQLPLPPDAVRCTLSIASESVLSSHENWVTGLAWAPRTRAVSFPPLLLSSSMDQSMIVWAPPDDKVGLWLEHTRVGNSGITGLSFLDCLWLPSDGSAIFGHNFQGSLSSWYHSQYDGLWSPGFPLCGHHGPVMDLSWSAVNTSASPFHLLFTVSSDQTVRAHAPLRLESRINSSDCFNDVSELYDHLWHEIARPQVHGYDMNAIASLSTISYVSAGDEKVARVFTATRSFVDACRQMLKLDDYPLGDNLLSVELAASSLAERAVQPTLGLSNQISVPSSVDLLDDAVTDSTVDSDNCVASSCDAPLPTEDRLQCATLWPEIKKLYGHPYEVYCLAAHPSRMLIASACVATKQIHACIILWNGLADWAIHQRLVHHQLTVTQMSWSHDGQHLLAVSRDRTWSVWSPEQANEQLPNYILTAFPAKGQGHTRIIWTGAWCPDDRYFLTGSRDKCLLVWCAPKKRAPAELIAVSCYPLNVRKVFLDGITALDVCQCSNVDPAVVSYLVAIGFESGTLILLILYRSVLMEPADLRWSAIFSLPPPWSHVPGKQVRRVAFEPTTFEMTGTTLTPVHLATGATDGVVRVFLIDRQRLSACLLAPYETVS
ncbi:Elongator complex protein 2 [Paragonimus heterotremus]|uniref:Elongator complex protein 2 n=1 Tax=Paragonimus heterotremus TaxID=100268 RepID=A0A8J4TA31_9TREM|nr:Elongator complex protein 2 [Paragonimus heterotremus]